MTSSLQTSSSAPAESSHSFLLHVSLHLVLATLVLCSFGCSKDLLNELKEIAQLRNQMVQEFHEQNINVNLENSTVLQIAFINSPLNEGPQQERARRAQETALFVKRNFAGIDRLERLSVSFVRNETRMIVINYTQQIDSYEFGKDASLIGALFPYNPQSAFKGEEDVMVTYNPARNESEVKITRLQLEGDLDRGVVLSPHFVVRGDATTAGRSSGIPDVVVFSFASYAPEKIFKGDPTLRIVADSYAVFSEKARNLSVMAEGGNEFLVQGVPLDKFLKITEAKTVIVELGTKQFLLSDDQLRALKDMATYIGTGRH
jgi:hypothetical protein